MANKIIFNGLIVALLQVASAEEADPEPYMNDAPLTIYVDAGKEIDQFLSLAKSIDGKLSVLGDALESITQKVSKLERKLEDLINPQTKSLCTSNTKAWVFYNCIDSLCVLSAAKAFYQLLLVCISICCSSAVATRPKRRAELACEKTHGLRSAGIRNNTIPYIINFVDDYGDSRNRDGVLIEKRFVLIIAMRWSFLHSNIKKLKFSFSNRIVSKRIKKVHTVGEYFLDSIILVELDSDVDYNYWLYPTCLYTSELNPKSGLMNDGKTIQIVEDSKCYIPYSKKLSPSEICVYGGYSFTNNLVFLVEEETTPQLFGFVHCNDYFEYQTLYKVFPYLDFIENIVWPKNGN